MQISQYARNVYGLAIRRDTEAEIGTWVRCTNADSNTAFFIVKNISEWVFSKLNGIKHRCRNVLCNGRVLDVQIRIYFMEIEKQVFTRAEAALYVIVFLLFCHGYKSL